jgi:hypothetical protein
MMAAPHVVSNFVALVRAQPHAAPVADVSAVAGLFQLTISAASSGAHCHEDCSGTDLERIFCSRIHQSTITRSTYNIEHHG